MNSSSLSPSPPKIPCHDPQRLLGYDINTLTSSHAFNWGISNSEIFNYWIEKYDTLSIPTTQPLHELLIYKLGFDIYYGKFTQNNENVMDLLIPKIKSKIRGIRAKRSAAAKVQFPVDESNLRRSRRLKEKNGNGSDDDDDENNNDNDNDNDNDDNNKKKNKKKSDNNDNDNNNNNKKNLTSRSKSVPSPSINFQINNNHAILSSKSSRAPASNKSMPLTIPCTQSPRTRTKIKVIPTTSPKNSFNSPVAVASGFPSTLSSCSSSSSSSSLSSANATSVKPSIKKKRTSKPTQKQAESNETTPPQKGFFTKLFGPGSNSIDAQNEGSQATAFSFERLKIRESQEEAERALRKAERKEAKMARARAKARAKSQRSAPLETEKKSFLADQLYQQKLRNEALEARLTQYAQPEMREEPFLGNERYQQKLRNDAFEARRPEQAQQQTQQIQPEERLKVPHVLPNDAYLHETQAELLLDLQERNDGLQALLADNTRMKFQPSKHAQHSLEAQHQNDILQNKPKKYSQVRQTTVETAKSSPIDHHPWEKTSDQNETPTQTNHRNSILAPRSPSPLSLPLPLKQKITAAAPSAHFRPKDHTAETSTLPSRRLNYHEPFDVKTSRSIPPDLGNPRTKTMQSCIPRSSQGISTDSLVAQEKRMMKFTLRMCRKMVVANREAMILSSTRQMEVLEAMEREI